MKEDKVVTALTKQEKLQTFMNGYWVGGAVAIIGGCLGIVIYDAVDNYKRKKRAEKHFAEIVAKAIKEVKEETKEESKES